MTVSSTTQLKSSPFDVLAPTYDKLFTHSLIGRAQREAVWRKMKKVFRSDSRILEINCGTGADAVCLAGLGVQVLALDSSAGMVAVTQRHIEEESLQQWVSVRQLPIQELGQLRQEGPFDGVLSNFGGLNCVHNLQPVAKDLARLLKPASPVLLCLMGRWCLWEMIYYLSRSQPAKAFRRVSRGETRVRLMDLRRPIADPATVSASKGHSVSAELHVRYPSVGQLVRAFAPHFRLRSLQAIGLVVPPSYLESWIARHPRFLQMGIALDACFSDWPGLRNLGDHYLVEMERT